MKTKTIFLITFILQINIAFSQNEPAINITYSKLLATYGFTKKLSDNYPDNETKRLFLSSKFNTQHYLDLIKQLDTLNIYESYVFQGYPTGQKTPVMTTFLIEKNLINASSVQEFKRQAFGIIPNTELLLFSHILSEFVPVYDSLIYLPNKDGFENQITELKSFVQKANLSHFFQKGLIFYSSSWDNSIPIDIAIIPSVSKGGFTAKAFLNNAVSEVPVNFKENDILFSVLMHEIYHTVYDGQSLELKLKIQSWFNSNASKNSQYAFLLLNEALATALGNGYVYEQINGKTDKTDWYNVKYINLMAKQVYPVVKEYLTQNKPIDKDFVNKYIALYDSSFSDWTNELDLLFANRFVITDNADDLYYLNRNYRYSSFNQSQIPISLSNLEQMKETPITKLIIVSSDNKNKLNLVKTTFPELKNWKYNAQNEFTYTVNLEDKAKLIIINRHKTSLDKLFDDNFKERRIE